METDAMTLPAHSLVLMLMIEEVWNSSWKVCSNGTESTYTERLRSVTKYFSPYNVALIVAYDLKKILDVFPKGFGI